MWAGKIDLKHAYFHLGLADHLKSYMRLKVGDHIFQFNAAAFGLSPLPQMWMQVMKVFQKIWRQKGIMCFFLPGRHSSREHDFSRSATGFGIHAANFEGGWNDGKHKKECTYTKPDRGPFGFYIEPPTRSFGSPPKQDSNREKGIRQSFDTSKHDMSKNGSNFGKHKKFSYGNAFSQGFYRSHVGICKPAKQMGLEKPLGNSKNTATRSTRIDPIDKFME